MPISPSALIGEIITRIFCPVLMITLRIWQPYRIGKNLFHRIFLQYKGSWAWRNFCPATVLSYTVSCEHAQSIQMLNITVSKTFYFSPMLMKIRQTNLDLLQS